MKLDIKKLEDIPWYWFIVCLIGGLPMLLLYLWDDEE